MSTILVLDTNILCVDPTDTGDSWVTPDQIIPKHVAEGAELIDVTLPEDYAPNKYTYDNGFVLIPPVVIPPTNDELLDQILTLQNKCLRCLVEDAPDTTWLNKYKAQISELRSQIK